MAVQLDAIRGTAERVAGSYGLEVVEVEFQGGAKFRTLRVYIEKNAAERAKLADAAAAGAVEDIGGVQMPKGVPAELLSGVTHEDCAKFAQDFGTVLDVEDLIPGAEYTLEVSSPGLERKLSRAEDYVRFSGSLVKVQTFTPVSEAGIRDQGLGKTKTKAGNRHWQGRLVKFEDGVLTLDLSAVKQKGKRGARSKGQGASDSVVEIELKNVEKAHLVAEI